MVKADGESRGTPIQRAFQVSVGSDTKDGPPTSNTACGLGGLRETSNVYDETPHLTEGVPSKNSVSIIFIGNQRIIIVLRKLDSFANPRLQLVVLITHNIGTVQSSGRRLVKTKMNCS